MTKLSVIVPVRTNTNYDVVERLAFNLYDKELDRNLVEFIVVDDGSDGIGRTELKNKCKSLGLRYFRIDSEDKYFSLARARNFGVQNANGEYILIKDVDFCPYDGFYSDILDEINLWDLENNKEEFFTIPAIWLTEEGSKQFLEDNSRYTAKKMVQKYLEFDTSMFEFEVPTGSTLVMSKHHYLSIGGQNELFDRWGFEDHEFAVRLLQFSNKFPRPINATEYKSDLYGDYVKYEGFRARYRLHGDILAQQGIYAFHVNHPISKEFRSKEIRDKNKNLFEKLRLNIERNKYYLPSLVDLTVKTKTLITSKNPYVWNRELMPLLGDVYYFDEGVHSADEFIKFIKDNSIDQVLMQNPYKNEKTLEIYRAIIGANITCIVGERGALPGSVYFDQTGFVCESKRYDEKYWDKDLSDEQLGVINGYIKDFKASSISLEKQGERLAAREIRSRLGIADRQKILFVPFQMRTDATIKYFAGKIETYENFENLVQTTVNKITDDWVVCYKNHPLEPNKVKIEGAICVDEFHINDLIEASSMVLLMNSGCGVLSLIYGKPVLHCSEAQYDNLKFNRYVSTSEEVLKYCTEPFDFDQKAALSFLYYLVFEFYSFAENICIKRKDKPDSWPVALYFKKIVFADGRTVIYGRNPAKAVWIKSSLFDRYRSYINDVFLTAKKKKNAPLTQPPVKAVISQNRKSDNNAKKLKSDAGGLDVNKKTVSHRYESAFFNAILNEKLAKKYNADRDKYFKDSRSVVAKLYYFINK